MKTNYNLRLSAAAVRANPRVRPLNKGRHTSLPLQFARHGQQGFALRGHLVLLAFAVLSTLIPQSSILAQTVGDTNTFTDSRDNQTYKAVFMPDGKWWMAENLKYRQGLDNPVFSNKTKLNPTDNSEAALKGLYYCPGPGPDITSVPVTQSDPLACEYWGCLYPWWTAVADSGKGKIPTTIANPLSTNYQPWITGVCPTGWRVPSDWDWGNLLNASESKTASQNHNPKTNATAATAYGATDSSGASSKLRSANVGTPKVYKLFWNSSTFKARDTFGFSAEAEGYKASAGGNYLQLGNYASFWASSIYDANNAFYREFRNTSYQTYRGADLKSTAKAVRCVQNDECDTEGINITINNTCFSYIDYKINTYSFAATLSEAVGSGVWDVTYSIINNNVNPGNITINPISGLATFSGLSISNIGQSFTVKVDITNGIRCKTDSLEFTIAGCPYTFSDRFDDATHICQQRSSGAQNWETWIKDSRDNQLYRIVQMLDTKWWLAESIRFNVSGSLDFIAQRNYRMYTVAQAGFTANGVEQRGICPVGWVIPNGNRVRNLAGKEVNNATFVRLIRSVNNGGTSDFYGLSVLSGGDGIITSPNQPGGQGLIYSTNCTHWYWGTISGFIEDIPNACGITGGKQQLRCLRP